MREVPPCGGHVVLQLFAEGTGQARRDEDRVTVVNAMTQDMGTVSTHIVDLADGTNTASIEFSSVQNATTFGQGVEHLGRLCGAGR